jgi:hypothetical protein
LFRGGRRSRSRRVIACRAATPLALLCAAVLLGGAAASAQAPDLPATPPADTIAGAPTAIPPALSAESPTVPPAPTSASTPTPADSATLPARTPTPAPRSSTATATPLSSAIGASAIPPALRALRHNLLPIALGAAIAIVAAWLGARIAGARERSARRRARRTLATAMLLELRRVDAVLRRVVALDNAAALPALDHPIMEAALRDLTMFRTDTAARVAQFHGALRGIQHEIGDYRDNPLRWAGRLAELNQLIKSRAAAACRAVPELMRALEREGGASPPHLSEPAANIAAAGTPDLPPPPFGATDGDDWTL